MNHHHHHHYRLRCHFLPSVRTARACGNGPAPIASACQRRASPPAHTSRCFCCLLHRAVLRPWRPCCGARAPLLLCCRAPRAHGGLHGVPGGWQGTRAPVLSRHLFTTRAVLTCVEQCGSVFLAWRSGGWQGTWEPALPRHLFNTRAVLICFEQCGSVSLAWRSSGGQGTWEPALPRPLFNTRAVLICFEQCGSVSLAWRSGG
eukprot:1157677-Pelagomonas_calceolata.AAC.12